MRIGHGYDVHRFGPGSGIKIGGVAIDYDQALIAHSDGDVAIHALCDALLGAAGLGDIGRHFPDTNKDYAAIDSRKLLRHVVALLEQQNLKPVNVDITVIAQAPKMAPHIPLMCERLAADLGVVRARVNVKATTTEQLGFCGRGEGIAAHAVVLLEE